MRRPNPFFLALAGLVLAALACGPTSGAPDPAAVTATFDALLTQAAKTAVAGSAPVAEVTEAPAEAPLEEPTEAPAVENTLPPDVTATNTAVPQPTEPGVPSVTANVNANVRKGSSTSHEVVGALLAGQTANIEGRNISGTWYLITFPPAPGGKGWIAASVVSVSGDQSNLPIVADPPTPTHTPTATFTATATFTPTATFTATSTATATATTAATTYSAGSLSIDQTFHADLDSGAVTSSGSDFWYRAASATQRYVTPENGATIAKAGSSSVGYAGCSTMSLSSSEIHVNDLPAGTYVCVKTSDGRYAEFMVTETVGASPSPLKISYTTWATP